MSGARTRGSARWSLVLLLAVVAGGCTRAPAPASLDVVYLDSHTLRGPRNFITDIDLVNPGGSHNMVVEIPAGTSEKWEVCTFGALSRPDRFPGCTATGAEMVHEMRNGARRVIRHLGYPGNYGALPQTRSGDDDPLDVLAIGPTAERGTVVPVTIIGVIRCLDDGEQDDKIIAVMPDSPLHGVVSTAAQLREQAPRSDAILLHWFMGYKGDDSMACEPLAGEAVAATIVSGAHAAYTQGLSKP